LEASFIVGIWMYFYMFDLKAALMVAIAKRHLSTQVDNDNLLTAIWKRLL
jgi:hypothetical protein